MCTHFLLTTQDNQTKVIGRSMEFGTDLDSKLLIRAPGTTFALEGADEEPATLTPRYGYVGMNTRGLDLVSDGINSAGLSVGTLWLPGSEFQRPSLKAANVPAFGFNDYALAHFATVAEVREAFATDRVRVYGGKLLAQFMPVHFPIVDASGDSIVIEFENGQAIVRDNPIGICTNRPFLPWHLDNLGNYTSLTAWDPNQVKMNNQTLPMNGHGSGLTGMPGDYTPPSRFVRMAYLRHWAEPQQTVEQTMQLAFHLLNNVDIPIGAVRSLNAQDKPEQDYTQWVVVKNLTTPEIRIRTYASPLVYRLSLQDLDFQALNHRQLVIPTAEAALPLPLS